MFRDFPRGSSYDDSLHQNPVQLTKNEEILKNKIPPHLRNYEQLKEWSDLGQWLLKLQQILEEHPCGYLPKKKLLCKRLAQCLSPVWTKAIHENALAIYELILRNLTTQKSSKYPEYSLVVDLPLFSLGLFPFFGYCSSQSKPMVLDILQKYYYPLGQQLTPLIGGLISSIIVGMEDTNEEQMKKVLSSLDSACECVGTRAFYGAMWMCIVRSSRTRAGAYKFLMKRWNQKAKQDTVDITSAETIESTPKRVNQADKLPNKSALVMNALLASLEDESPLIKRAALDFLSVHAKIQDGIFSKEENLVLVQACLLLFIKVDHAVLRRINNWFFGEAEMEPERLQDSEIIYLISQALNRILIEDNQKSEQDTQHFPLKIIQSWYMQHPETVELTLESIGYQLVKYMYQQNVNPTGQKASERLVESIASNCELILQSLYKLLHQKIQEKKVDQVLEIVRLLNYSFEQLMKGLFNCDHVGSNPKLFQERTVSLQKLVQIIVTQIIEIPPDQFFQLPLTEAVLDLALSSMQKIQKRVEILKVEMVEEINVDAVIKFADYYVSVNVYACDNAENLEERGKFVIFQQISQILIRTQLFVMRSHQVKYDSIPSWVSALFNSINSMSPRIAIASIEILLEITQQQSHENTKKLADLLVSNQEEGIISMSSSLYISEFKQKIPESLNYMKEVFKRLWSLLDYHNQDSKVIDSILHYSKNFPNIFTYVIETAFLNSQDDNQLETAIRRYQIFCRLTNPHFRKFSHENKGVGVMMMLSFLEHENPLIRHASKTWLAETAPFYFRILDPLIETLIQAQLQGDAQLNPETQELVYANTYNTEIVIDTVKKFSLILNDVKEWYLEYIVNAKLSKTLQDKLKQYPRLDTYDLKYIALIMNILSRFIQGTSKLPGDFKRENSRVNALCCEHFESLLSQLQDKVPKAQIIVTYMEQVLSYLKLLIQKQDSLMQIQVLNLLKQFILQSKDVEQSMSTLMRRDLMHILSSQNFIQNMLDGLNTSKVFYLKKRYLNTLCLSIYSISEILPNKVLTERVHLILNTLLSLLRNHEYNKYTRKPRNNDFHEAQFRTAHRISNIDYAQSQVFMSSSRKQDSKNHSFQAENLDDIQMTSQSGENFEEVMSLSNSVKTLMNFFFQFKDEIKDDQSENKQNFQGILIDILTLNLLKKTQPPQQKSSQPQFLQYQDTSQMILKSLPVIISSYLFCWKLGGVNWNFFTSKGSQVYEYIKFEDFYNSIKYQSQRPEEQYTDDDLIKQNILSIMRPCMSQFMTEFVSACLEIWSKECNLNFYDPPVSNQTQQKLMELLILLNVEPEPFLVALMKTSQLSEVQLYYQRKPKKSLQYLNKEQSQLENYILYFVYVFLSANIQNAPRGAQLVQFWLTSLQFTKVFLQSRHINTVCWLLEFFYLISWKYSPKEVLISQELRKELHSQLRQILSNLADFCTEKLTFQMVSIPADSMRSSFVVNSKAQFQLTTPFTPVIYELYQEYQDTLSEDGEKTEELRDLFWIQRSLFDPYRQKGENLTAQEYSRKCSLIAFKTLKRISYITLINTYEASKMDRVVENTKEFMSQIFPLTENKTEENIIIVEACSEIIYNLLKNSRDQLTKEFKKQILEIFNGQDFFKCSRRSLKYWKEIIDWTSDKGDLLMDQLGGNSNVFSGFAGLFLSRNSETIKKIKSFERVCFIIYSGSVDKYNSKINVLLEAILDSIKEVTNQHPAITILILFCIRILILRLSPQSLNQVFRKIWPSLISMLMQIFNRKGEPLRNPNVLLAGLKLVELLSLFQLEEFYFYQWMFVFDYFGITIEMKEPSTPVNKVKINTQFDFVPYIAYQYPSFKDFTVEYENKLYPDQWQVTHGKRKRLVIIKDPMVRNNLTEAETEVRLQAVYLCQYLIDINQQRVEVSLQQLEALIEAEFISLDDYIFSIQ